MANPGCEKLLVKHISVSVSMGLCMGSLHGVFALTLNDTAQEEVQRTTQSRHRHQALCRHVHPVSLPYLHDPYLAIFQRTFWGLGQGELGKIET